MSPLFELRGVRVGFPRRPSVRGRTHPLACLTMNASTGQMIGIVGGPGAGKTLLAQAITGLLPDHAVREGPVLLDGAPAPGRLGTDLALVVGPKSTDAFDTHRGIVFSPTRDSRQERSRLCSMTIVPRSHTPASDGLRIIGSLARARLVVADEPDPTGDPGSIRQTMVRLRRIADEGRCVLVLSRGCGELRQFADRMIMLRDGILATALPSQKFVIGLPRCTEVPRQTHLIR